MITVHCLGKGDVLCHIDLEPSERFLVQITGASSLLEKQIIEWANAYISKNPVPFLGQLSFEGLSPFQVDVYEALLKIGFGETISYQGLAELASRPRGARSVGKAMGDNPFPLLIPCHRVIQKNGEIGGYAYGSKLKESLLTHEQAVR